MNQVQKVTNENVLHVELTLRLVKKHTVDLLF